MKLLSIIAAAALVALPASALEVVYMELENNQGNAENAFALTTQLKAADTLTVPLSRIDRFIADPTNGIPDRIIELPANLGRIAMENGWTPTHHLNVVVAMGFYTKPDRVNGPFSRVTSSPKNTLSYDAALKLMESGTQHNVAKDHFSCMRQIFAGSTDACVTAAGIARRYSQRFGVELELSGQAIDFGPIALYVSPGVTEKQREFLKTITVDMPRGTSFEPISGGES